MVSQGLDFQRPQDWVRLHRERSSTPPADPIGLRRWVHFRYVVTRQDTDLDRAIELLLKRHVAGNARWLAVDGESTIGKSETITAALLRRAMARPESWYRRNSDGCLHVPYVYVVATSPSTLDLLRDVCEFLALPTEGKEHDLLKRLKQNLPRLGTRLIVVDEAQMFRRKSAGASTVTDNLRNILHLPVPFVFVGVDLPASALLRDWGVNNDTVRQLRRRHDMLSLRRWDGTEGVAHINAMVTAFGKQIRRIGGIGVSGLTDTAILAELAIRCEGRPGAMLEALKNAAVLAVEDHGDLSSEFIDQSLPPTPPHAGTRRMTP